MKKLPFHLPRYLPRCVAFAAGQSLITYLRVVCVLWLLAGTSGAFAQTPTIYLGDAAGAPATCNCLNNASNGVGGQFAQTISVSAPAGQTWTVTSATGLFTSTSPAPPGTLTPIAPGTVLTETSAGLYQLSAIHVDGAGFTLTVSNGSGIALSTANTCFYPDVSIVGLPDTVCQTSLPVPLVAETNGVTGTGVFTINGNAATVFSAQALGQGTYTVAYTFDAGAAAPGDPTDPGCTVTITQQVVVPLQPTLALNAQVNITFGPTCMATIVPDMVLEGNYPCMDDFIITVFDPQGNSLGNVVDGQFAEQLLIVEVMSLAGQFIGSSSIFFDDETNPTIECPEDDHFAEIPQAVQFLSGNLSTVDPTFFPNNFACFAPVVAPMSGIHYYQLETFTVSATDTYAFELSSSIAGGAGFALYQGAFNPFGGPCQNIVGAGQPVPDGQGVYQNQSGTPGISAMLMAGEEYTLLTTSFAGNAQGSYTYAIYSAGPGQVAGLAASITPVNLPIYCSSATDLFNNPNSLPFTGEPIAADNCMQNAEVTFTDALTNNGLCGVSIIERTFTVTDQSDNTAQCVQEIQLPPIDLDQVNLPPKNLMLECNTAYETLPNGNPAPSETGFPFVQTAFGIFTINPSYCNILGSYNDQSMVSACAGNEQFVRRWTIFDNCDPSEIITYDQIIQIVDRTGPTIVAPAPDLNLDGIPDTLLYSTGSAGCFATFQVPPAVVTDNCGTFTTATEIITEEIVEITNAFGFVISIDTNIVVLATLTPGSNLVTDIPQGTHLVRYRATDACNNTSELLLPIKVTDFTSPTAICDDELALSLNNQGVGILFAIDVDEGSSDNCGIVSYELRRMLDFDPEDCSPVVPAFTAWGPSVNFYCCEVGTTMTVELRVTDASGNTNTCMTDVMINDLTPPTCIAPPPVVTACAALPDNFTADSLLQLATLFGTADLIDGCDASVVEELAPIVQLDDCGAGLVIRRFQAIDAAGNISTNSCEQIISIMPGTSYEIKFPQDVIGECGDDQADSLVVNATGCENMAITSNDEVFTIDNGLACFKILRTYSVINWCEYDGISEAFEVSRDEDCDGTGGEADVWVIRRPTTTYIDTDNDETNTTPAAGTRGLTCDGQTNPAGYLRTVTSVGYWKYTQVIKVFDTTAPSIVAATPEPYCADNTCQGVVDLSFSVEDDCPNVNMVVMAWFDAGNDGTLDGNITNQALSGTYPNYNLSGSYPIGEHAFRIRVEDNCGNIDEATVPFTVIDCDVATPTCLDNLISGLTPLPPGTDIDGDGDIDNGAVTVDVNTFLQPVQPADCTPPLSYSLHRMAAIQSGAELPNPGQQSLVFTCDDIGQVPLRVYVWDSAFNPYAIQPDGSLGGPNYTFCETGLIIDDSDGVCAGTVGPLTAMVSGTIITELGETVAQIDVHPGPNMPTMMTTANDGFYELELDMYENYEVMPQSGNDWDNGVSTFDIILISKHILGIETLDSPYKIIAADINHSNSVSTIDLIYLRKLVLGIAIDFPNNTSWRFVDANYIFPDPSDPWQEVFPEMIAVSDLTQDVSTGDFIAIKVGDVNLTAQANAVAQTVSPHSTFVQYLRTEEREYVAGEEFSVIFTANDAEDLLGFQFTLQYHPTQLVLEAIEPGRLTEDEIYHPATGAGWLTASWHQHDQHMAEADDAPYFTLRFRALQSGKLSESLGLSSTRTAAEAYTVTEEQTSLGLNFTPVDQSDDFRLEQNRPNPFGHETVIGFHLPADGEVTLRVFGTNGKEYLQVRRHCLAGYNTLLVNAADIAARGVLYYQIETGPYTATRKMVIF